MTELIVRSSDFIKFQRCRRAFYLNNVLEVQQRPFQGRAASKADIGTLVHAGLAGFYGSIPMETMVQTKKLELMSEGVEPDSLNKAMELALHMIHGYEMWAHGDNLDSGLVPALQEAQLQTPIYTEDDLTIILSGTPDLVLTDTTGYYVLIDFKTVDAMARIQPTLDMDLQLLNYAVLLQKSNGWRISVAAHRQLKRIRRDGRAQGPFFSEETVFFTPAQIEVHERHLKRVAKEIWNLVKETENAELYPHDVAYPSPSKDCSWACPFVGICSSLDKTNDAFIALKSEVMK